MMIFRYWLMNGRTFDEVSPVQDQPVDVVRDHLAASLCPPVSKPRDAWIIPAFHVKDTKGVAHVVVTANLVEVEVLEVEDPAPDPAPAVGTFTAPYGSAEPQGLELPGMWHQADFTGGQDEVRSRHLSVVPD
jgi:hypothetical protein